MRKIPLLGWLALIALGALLALAVLLLTSDPADRDELRSESTKGLIQLVLVVLLGTALKLLVDHYQNQEHLAEQIRQDHEHLEEQNRQFRQDKYDRLVQSTNQLRRAWVLVEANRSVKTWSEQMHAVIEAGLTLRMIKHQIYSSRDVQDPPFPNHSEIVRLIELMYGYTDWVVSDFADHKKDLSEQQRQAEDPDLNAAARSELQAEVWQQLQALESVKDALTEFTEVTRKDREKCRELIKAVVGSDEVTDPRREIATQSRLTYEEAESLALEAITETTMARGRSTQQRNRS